ncbi:uncharacterized protein CTHT_0020490 [Thermochaetoides thermophila DSM 1495]|uniref:Uncharacterized protein n=1 Tax=Chaetomium thermophilum (strain DSM 1495 / CBS 144.50 / IMI 039719) TaxID=759272 RepID=G0S3C2_CHATD|nr:hypothetical protein CTHT_0020490 [Thermochaetoides thermophila DSM 1495]EGS22505.1 hypothetical protein CTHT_0020490 [Thermochaetoides thermophila DSM 1495]
MQRKAINAHATTNNAVITVLNHIIPALPRALPNLIEARVKPTLGKTKLHQLRWNLRSGIPTKTATTADAKNQKLNPQRKTATQRASSRIAAPNICTSVPSNPSRTALIPLTAGPVSPASSSSTLGISAAMATNTEHVKLGGPTAMNIPGLCTGSPKAISRDRYVA